MIEEKIVFKGKTKNGIPYIIRYPGKNDAHLMHAYINSLSKEKTYILFQGEEISLKNETRYLKDKLKKTKNKKCVQLCVFCKNKIVGIADIDLKDRVQGHQGVLGISLQKEFRGEGIGKKLMSLIIEEAVKNLPELKIIILAVFDNNLLAIEMYKKFGFQEYGKLPKGIKHNSQYVDEVFMFKKVKKSPLKDLNSKYNKNKFKKVF